MLNHNTEIINEEEVENVVSMCIDRRPNSIQVEKVSSTKFEEGFGVNSDLYTTHITYKTQYQGKLPSTILVKQYKPELISTSKGVRNANPVYEGEMTFYEFANIRLTTLGDGERLFPICYNAGLESKSNPENIKNTLTRLRSRRILILELLGNNLDRTIYELRRQLGELRTGARRSNDEDEELVKEINDRANEIESQIFSYVDNSLRTTKHFHDLVKEGKLKHREFGPSTFLKKLIAYHDKLGHKLDKKKRSELRETYLPFGSILSGRDSRTKNLEGIVHGDLHPGNIILGNNDQIRFTDAANIITKGATVALDIAPQLFNPPVVCISPDKALDKIGSTYLSIDEKEKSRNLTLATILAGHNWCLEAAAANAIAKIRNPAQYAVFLSRHKNHENAIPHYLASSHLLLTFLIDNYNEFNLESTLVDSLKKLRDFDYNLHRDEIEQGKNTLELIN